MREADVKYVLECSIVINGYGVSKDACLSGCVFRVGRRGEPEQIPEGGWEGQREPPQRSPRGRSTACTKG